MPAVEGGNRVDSRGVIVSLVEGLSRVVGRGR